MEMNELGTYATFRVPTTSDMKLNCKCTMFPSFSTHSNLPTVEMKIHKTK